MTAWLWLSVFVITVATSASVSVLMPTGVCDGRLHQLANNIRKSTEDVLTESVKLALTVFSGLDELTRITHAKRNSAPDIPVDLESVYLALTKALKLRQSQKQRASFISAMVEIKNEYLKTCFSAESKPTLESLSRDFGIHPSPGTLESLSRDFGILSRDFGILSRDLVTARAAKDEKRKEYLLRSVFAKATCFDKRIQARSTRSTNFFKSITADEAKDMFGFHFNIHEDHFPALAFVIDTTGSMANQIEAATNIIAEIIKREQQNPFFYVLTPFNDYDGDPTYAGKPNAGPNTVATTRDELGPAGEELITLYLAVNDSRAHSGGDAPEYCMSGILEAFGATYTTNENYTLSLFANGSQIIVITDAEAKDAHKSSNVIRVADESNTQINFLLTTGMSSYSLYKNISEATGGVVVYSNLEKGDELKILTDFASVRMAHERRKRKVKRIAEVDPTRMGGEAPPVANCFEYITSMFTSNVNGFVSSTAPSVKVTSPDGVTVKMSSYPTFNTYWPMPGKWKICAPSGLKLNANVQSETEINFAVSFLVESTSQFLVAEEMPSVCTNGTLMVTFLGQNDSSKVSSTKPLYLDFLSDTKKVVKTVALSKCDDILTGSVKYPKEAIAFMSLRGLDALGNSFEYTTKEPRSLSFVGPSGLRFNTSVDFLTSIPVPITTYRNFSFTLLTDSDGLFNINVSISSTSSHLFLTPLQGTRVVLNRSARVSVSVLVKTSAPLNETISFDVKATYMSNCDVGASYSQRILVSPNVGPAVDKCGGCKNGGTCTSIIGRNRCLCRSGYIGVYCQTKI